MCTNDSRWRKTKPSIGRRSTTLLDARPFWQVSNPSSIESLKVSSIFPPQTIFWRPGRLKRSPQHRSLPHGDPHVFGPQSEESMLNFRFSPHQVYLEIVVGVHPLIQMLHHTSFLCESDPREDFATQILLRNTGMRRAVTEGKVCRPIGRSTVGRPSVYSRSTFNRHSTDSRSTVDRPIGRPSVDCRSTVDRRSTDCRFHGAKVHMIQFVMSENTSNGKTRGNRLDYRRINSLIESSSSLSIRREIRFTNEDGDSCVRSSPTQTSHGSTKSHNFCVNMVIPANFLLLSSPSTT